MSKTNKLLDRLNLQAATHPGCQWVVKRVTCEGDISFLCQGKWSNKQREKFSNPLVMVEYLRQLAWSVKGCNVVIDPLRKDPVSVEVAVPQVKKATKAKKGGDKMVKRVFISGSRGVKLTAKMKEAVRSMLSKGYEILVGDCYGVDADVQQLLSSHGYWNCRIYFIGNKPRYTQKGLHNHWIPGTRFEDKDIAMSKDCDYAICFWDGKSKGTKANIDRLKKLGKPVYVVRQDDTSSSC